MTIKQVWKCPQCATVYESPIAASEVLCSAKVHGKKYVWMKIESGEIPQKKGKKNDKVVF